MTPGFLTPPRSAWNSDWDTIESYLMLPVPLPLPFLLSDCPSTTHPGPPLPLHFPKYHSPLRDFSFLSCAAGRARSVTTPPPRSTARLDRARLRRPCRCVRTLSIEHSLPRSRALCAESRRGHAAGGTCSACSHVDACATVRVCNKQWPRRRTLLLSPHRRLRCRLRVSGGAPAPSCSQAARRHAS